MKKLLLFSMALAAFAPGERVLWRGDADPDTVAAATGVAAEPADVVAMLLGVGAMVAGAKTGAGPGASQIGMAALSGPQEMIRRSLMSYQRGEEQAADRAAIAAWLEKVHPVKRSVHKDRTSPTRTTSVASATEKHS